MDRSHRCGERLVFSRRSVMLKIAVLLSGSGRTLDNFHEKIASDALSAEIQVVVSNLPDALGLKKAQDYGYPAFFAEGDDEINRRLEQFEVDLVCLAGYLQLYTPPTQLKKAVLNIHPSLIPAFCGKKYYGMKVHRAVRQRGCMVSGCTVHFANAHYDEGPIVLQRCVALEYEDDAEAIATKVFAAECAAYPEALNKITGSGLSLFVVAGRVWSSHLGLSDVPLKLNQHTLSLPVDELCGSVKKKRADMEILAPVGGIENFWAALEAGADAFYFGAPGFNARNLSHELQLEELWTMVDIAHDRGKKAYVACNSLVVEKELAGLVDVLALLEKFQVDGVIVQDLAVLHLIKKFFPRLRLHASTLTGAASYVAVERFARM
ncbi:unnamed protein product, partial [Cyprideis torosa]